MLTATRPSSQGAWNDASAPPAPVPSSPGMRQSRELRDDPSFSSGVQVSAETTPEEGTVVFRKGNGTEPPETINSDKG